MSKVNNVTIKENPKTDIPCDNAKKLHELTDKELEKVSGSVPGWWDYNDVTPHN